ncbi:MAG: protein kinase, partial [Myxococcota bacterium]
YMVMEYVEGDTLQTTYEKNYREGRRLTETEAFDIMLQMMEGVSVAHGQGIVHRDLKPDNVILSRDDKGQTLVKILDFGIAKLKASGEMDRGLTRPGVVMGTPEYMAPEQAFSADRVDVRADVFSMGVMFFEMLAGRRPVGGDNAHAIAAQYLEGRVARLDELAPHLAGPLCDAVHQAMSAEPEQRFLSVAAFRTAIADHAPSDLEASLSDTAEGSDGALAAAAAGITAGDEKGRGPRGPGDEHDDDAAAAPATAGMGVAEAPPLAVDPHAGGLDDTAAALSGDDGEPPAVNPTGTVAMDHLVPAPAAHPGTDPMGTPGEDQVTPPAGGTVVGEGFVPPPFEPSGAPSPFEGPAGGLGAVPATSSLGVTPPPAVAAAAPPPGGAARRAKRGGGGTSMFSIFLIAGGVAAAVVGGIYIAQEAGGGTSDDDRGAARTSRSRDDDATTRDPDPKPEETPETEPADPEPVTDPDVVPPPPPPPPAPRPPPPPSPKTKPTPRPPPPPPRPVPVIPSALPKLPPIPSGFPFPPGAVPPIFPAPPNPAPRVAPRTPNAPKAPAPTAPAPKPTPEREPKPTPEPKPGSPSVAPPAPAPASPRRPRLPRIRRGS